MMTGRSTRTLATAAICALAFAAPASAEESRRLDLTGFDRIDVSGVYELDVEVGSDFSVVLSGDERELARAQATVKSGVLRLSQEERKKKRWGRDNDGVEAVITLPALNGVEVSGVVDGKIAGVDAENFKIRISGVGDVTIEGACGVLDASVSGVGDLDAEGLRCADVEIRLSGVGDASVFASNRIDASVSGMGQIDVYGSPSDVTTNDSMFSEINIK